MSKTLFNQPSRTFGPAYEPELDSERIEKQHEAIRDFMLAEPENGHSQWWTLAEIREKLDHPEASISAQLRHLRKAEFGGYKVEKRRRSGGTWEYKVQEQENGKWTNGIS